MIVKKNFFIWYFNKYTISLYQEKFSEIKNVNFFIVKVYEEVSSRE